MSLEHEQRISSLEVQVGVLKVQHRHQQDSLQTLVDTIGPMAKQLNAVHTSVTAAKFGWKVLATTGSVIAIVLGLVVTAYKTFFGA